jgi:hypothetical protein
MQKEKANGFCIHTAFILGILLLEMGQVSLPLSGYCEWADHAPNRQDDDFGEKLLKQLTECRGFFKDFFFTNSLRGFALANPSLCVPAIPCTRLQ